MLTIMNSRNTFKYATLEEYRALLLGMRGAVIRAEQLGLNVAQIPRDIGIDIDGTPALARVVHGRWVADCPQDGCMGAMDVTPGEPALCSYCFNCGIDFRWRRVIFPEDIEGIEAALRVRLLPETANWVPGETVDALIAENIAHGIEVTA